MSEAIGEQAAAFLQTIVPGGRLLDGQKAQLGHIISGQLAKAQSAVIVTDYEDAVASLNVITDHAYEVEIWDEYLEPRRGMAQQVINIALTQGETRLAEDGFNPEAFRQLRQILVETAKLGELMWVDGSQHHDEEDYSPIFRTIDDFFVRVGQKRQEVVARLGREIDEALAQEDPATARRLWEKARSIFPSSHEVRDRALAVELPAEREARLRRELVEDRKKIVEAEVNKSMEETSIVWPKDMTGFKTSLPFRLHGSLIVARSAMLFGEYEEALGIISKILDQVPNNDFLLKIQAYLKNKIDQ